MARRRDVPLGIYNFSGDLGKALLPALAAVLLPILTWRPVLGLMAVLGIALALALVSLAPAAPVTRNATERRLLAVAAAASAF